MLTLSWQRSLSYRNSLLICSANQWTGFYMIEPIVMKEFRYYPFTSCLFVFIADFQQVLKLFIVIQERWIFLKTNSWSLFLCCTEACNFAKSNTLTFFKLCKWYQMAQSVSNHRNLFKYYFVFIFQCAFDFSSSRLSLTTKYSLR